MMKTQVKVTITVGIKSLWAQAFKQAQDRAATYKINTFIDSESFA